MRSKVELKGKRFNRWQVINEGGRTSGGQVLWLCVCDCGESREVSSSSLVQGISKSCGCIRAEKIAKRCTMHGDSTRKNRHKLYGVWFDIKRRCTSEYRVCYKDYGGRGIAVCDEWADNYLAFKKWAVENGYKEGLEIDRKNNDEGYHPGNCHWVTHLKNMQNTRRNIFIDAFGETKCISEWERDVKSRVSRKSIIYRIDKLGWTPEQAITTPAYKRPTI